MKILLAEDDKNLGRLLQNLLKKENIKTDWVEDGEAAYEQCYRDGYDVLILDWMKRYIPTAPAAPARLKCLASRC